ncbi:MAG: R3H domain-containing nucleic acid-binding protein [Patescibacteria group bacterium]
MNKKLATQVRDLVAEFLSKLGFTAEYETTVDFDTTENHYMVTVTTPDPSVLIGYHGDTISSLQLLLSQHLHAATGEWVSVSLNINDYRERRETALHALADTIVEKVLATGLPQTLPALPANERRVIHVYLSEHPQVTTASQGEGRFRTVVISPKV